MAEVADWHEFTRRTDSIPWLKQHRDWIEATNAGFGDRPLHYMWYLLAKKLPKKARLLEIGVYKGQIISLWGLLARKLHKDFEIYGIVPLDQEVSDKYHTHEPISMQDIGKTLAQFGVNATIIDGFSTDPSIEPIEDLDLLYIDGGHDEDTVRSDIERFVPHVKKGGIIVFDDASCFLPRYGDHWYKGLEDVSKVVGEFSDTHEEFLRVGHNRCFYAN